MEYIINNREPAALFHYFEDICAIPHGSGNESAIADYIVSFAEKNGLYSYRDNNNNVLVKRPAADGFGSHPPILLQGHTDMVCECEPDCGIDMSKDGLKLRVEDGLLMATGTTLGADDGVAVAVMLALLSDPQLKAPAIECLFTTEEETGLTGASAFDYSRISARRMINLDTGGEVIIVSCAGGMRTRIMTKASAVSYSGKALSVVVSGFAGGHSGVDIHRGLGNANLITVELIKAAAEVTGCRILTLRGGSKDNAIPSRCEAVISVADEELAQKAITDKFDKIKKTLIPADDAANLTINAVDYNGKAPTPEFTERFIALTDALPHGIIEYNDDIEMVVTSQNYAVVDLMDGNFCLHLSSRSSVSKDLDNIASDLCNIAREYGFDAVTDSRYEGWAYEKESAIRDAYIEAYRNVTGKDIPVMGIHAGLECGIIKLAIPDMDIIATGAVTIGEHTTKEALDLDSFGRVYNIVKLLCESI